MKKQTLSLLLVFVLLMSLLPGAAMAVYDKTDKTETAESVEETEEAEAAKVEPEAPAEEAAAPEEPDETEETAAICAEGETLSVSEGVAVCEEGGTIYNNGATVYNNGGTVYNNFGICFHNAGLCYNNSGIVYANGGEVFNNAGTVYTNGEGIVHAFDDESVIAAADDTVYVSFDGEYAMYAELSGFSTDDKGRMFLAEDDVLTVTPNNGYVIVSASATSGVFAESSDGSYTLRDITESTELSLSFALAAPEIDPEGGAYDDDHLITVFSLDGATIRYTTDGTEPDENSEEYTAPIELEQSMVFTARAFMEGVEPSESVSVRYTVPEIEHKDLKAVKEGYDKAETLAFTVTNDCEEDLVIKSVALGGENAGSFTLSTKKGGTIAAGESDDETWTVTPKVKLKAGTYSATVSFTLESGDVLSEDIEFTVKAK